MILNNSAIVFYLFCFILGSLGSPKPQVIQQNQTSPSLRAPITNFDVVIVGGGPSGLSALSSLVRVRWKALLIDSGEYRNAQTRNFNDVISSDATVPSLFRAKAREQIARYPTAFFQSGNVTSIERVDNNSSFITTLSSGQSYRSRQIILATGIEDVLPNTPGIREGWARGMFWCAWCDSWEHRDQPLGIITPFTKLINSLYQVITMNNDIIIFVNGTDTPANRIELNKISPDWQKQLASHGITLENRTITSIERLQDGSVVKNETSREEFDIFQVRLEDGTQVLRGAFLVNFPKRQRSHLGERIGVKVIDERMKVDPLSMKASPGVWAVGDANNDGPTNVPHALYTGKKAGVSIHFELAKQSTSDQVKRKRSESEVYEHLSDNSLESLWQNLKKKTR